MNIELTALVTLISLGLTYLGYRKGVTDTTKEEGRANGRLEADIQYIKRLQEDILLQQKTTRQSLEDILERVTRNEESIKQAHKRIDEIKTR